MMLTTEPVTLYHMGCVAEHMRFADSKEAWLDALYRPMHALQASVENSSESYTLLCNNTPLAIYGLGRDPDPTIGHPWLLGTTWLEHGEGRRWLVRGALIVVGEFLQKKTLLENWVWKGNRTSIRWLKWLGFQFDRPVQRGANSAWFYRFSMKGVA